MMHSDLREAAHSGSSAKIVVNRDDLLALLADYDTALAAGEPKRKAAAKKAAAAPVGALPGWLPLEAWEAFLAMRIKIKKPATEYAQKLLLKKLAEFMAAGFSAQDVLEQSITSGWQDLYAPKGQQPRAQDRRALPDRREDPAQTAARRDRWGLNGGNDASR